MEAEIVVLGSVASSEGRMTCEVLKTMVLKRLHRPMIFATTVEEVQTAARYGSRYCRFGNGNQARGHLCKLYITLQDSLFAGCY